MKSIQTLLPPAVAGLCTITHPSSTISAEAEAFDWRWNLDGATSEEKQSLSRMLYETKRFVSAMQRGEQPYILSLLGISEIGKTHLARRVSAFFRRYLEIYVDPRTQARLCRRGGRVEWREVATAARQRDWTMVEDIKHDWLVILDDVGAEHQTADAFTISVLDQILNERVGCQWTMVTANLSLRKIAEEWDPRIASRLRRDGGACVDVPQTVRMYGKRIWTKAA